MYFSDTLENSRCFFHTKQTLTAGYGGRKHSRLSPEAFIIPSRHSTLPTPSSTMSVAL